MAYYYTDFNNRRKSNTSWDDGIIFEKEDFLLIYIKDVQK